MRKRRLALLSILALLLFAYALGAPAIADIPLWDQTYGGAEYDEVFALVECSGGGFAIGGVTRSYGAGNQDAWLIRTDGTGTHLWNQTYGGGNTDEIFALVECSNGDFALGGTSNSYAGGVGAWIIRTDQDGNHLWNRTYDGGSATGRDLVECSTGGFALWGTNHHGTAEDDLWLLRTDASGNPVWNRTFGYPGYDESARALVECTNGDFACLGIAGAGAFDDAWLIRTNSTGHHLWNATYGGTENDMPYDLIEVTDGGLAFTGDYMGDVWLVRTDSSGTMLWEKYYSADASVYARSLVECADGGFAITGKTDSWGLTHYDFVLTRTDSAGTHLWYKTFGGSGWDDGKAIVQASNGDFLIAGETDSYGAGLWDAWLIRTTDAAPTSPTPMIPGFPLEAIILGLAVTLGIGVLYRRRRS